MLTDRGGDFYIPFDSAPIVRRLAVGLDGAAVRIDIRDAEGGRLSRRVGRPGIRCDRQQAALDVIGRLRQTDLGKIDAKDCWLQEFTLIGPVDQIGPGTWRRRFG